MIEATNEAPGETAAAAVWGATPEQRDVWPARTQELLLRAALIADERALAAWTELQPQMSVAALDGATQALLPILRKNLVALGVQDELLDLFKGVHRFSWARNQMLLAGMIPVVAELERAGIPTLLLKGAAFVADKRLDAGMRPMNDVDVLVPSDRTREAIECLRDLGLEPVGDVPAWYVADYAPRFVPSHGFRDEQDRQLDLHWNVLHASRQPDADDDFWAAAVPIELLGLRTRALCPADELLLVILHGLRWNAIPTYRWVLDAALLAQGVFGPIDYDRLVEQARKRRVTVALRAGLSYLHEIVDVPLPSGVLEALKSARASPLERLELHIQTTQPRLRSRVQWEVLYHQQYLRHHLGLAEKPSLRRHLRLARRRLGVERFRQFSELGSGGCPGPSRPSSEMAAAVGKGAEHASSALPIAFGGPIDMDLTGLGRDYVAYGIWCPEAGGSWIAGREAKLVMPLERDARSSLLLEISAQGFLGAAHPKQRLEVLVNDCPVGALEVDVNRTLRRESLVIPYELVAGRQRLELTLRAPDAVSPARLGVADDDRRLGVFLRRLVVHEPRTSQIGSATMLGEGSGDECTLAGGWSDPEASGRWTYGELAQLMLRLEPSQTPLELEFDAVPLLSGTRPTLRADVTVNGEAVGSVEYDEQSPCPSTTCLALPAAVARSSGELLVAWRVHDPRSPQTLGLSRDTRPLGLFLERIALVPGRSWLAGSVPSVKALPHSAPPKSIT
ncbi:MAG TPA: nucleotidyltransferase family protein [Solirubrobacteraceae bacterium]|jgi:hypothetical protein|nr:nucleotidyltransferase family protein [Solirubrobacteraceae bacterium]